MAVPRNRLSNARKNSRRAHHAKVPKNAVSCSNCQGKKMSHKVCPHCGHYAGRSIAK
jgi:large subunit ribosomal protein L32